jgi:hypothetical protein
MLKITEEQRKEAARLLNIISSESILSPAQYEEMLATNKLAKDEA